jgi:hypothetical protein
MVMAAPVIANTEMALALLSETIMKMWQGVNTQTINDGGMYKVAHSLFRTI